MFINKDTNIDLNAELTHGVVRFKGYLHIGKVGIHWMTANVFEEMLKRQDYSSLIESIIKEMTTCLTKTLNKSFEDCKIQALGSLTNQVYDIFGVPYKERKSSFKTEP